jgi:hypothetical protein
MPQSSEPIFVMGMQRSGTTLMRSLLSSHPAIALSPTESHYLERQARVPLQPAADQFDHFWRTLTASRFFTSLDLDADTTKAQILEAGITHRNVFRILLERYAETQGKRRWGDKTPGQELDHQTLLEWFPDAQLVYMVRDPRAVIASILTKWEQRARPRVDVYAERWQESARLASVLAHHPNVRVVYYERLTEHPKRELRALCRFLGEPYTPEHLRPRRIRTKSLDKWRTVLSPGQVAIIEHVAREQMIVHGYAATTERLPLHVVPGFALTRAGRKIVRYTRSIGARVSAPGRSHSPHL